MGLKLDTEKVLIWDSDINKMVIKTEVTVSLVGNHGSIYAVKGPIYCTNAQEIYEANLMLRHRLVGYLVPSDRMI